MRIGYEMSTPKEEFCFYSVIGHRFYYGPTRNKHLEINPERGVTLFQRANEFPYFGLVSLGNEQSELRTMPVSVLLDFFIDVLN